MINVDAKIGSKVTATRFQKVLSEIIHFNQNGYVKGRTIFDAVRTRADKGWAVKRARPSKKV